MAVDTSEIVKLGWDNNTTTGTWSMVSGTANSGFEVTNLGDLDRKKTFRSTAGETGTIEFKLTLAASDTLNAIVLASSNIQVGATCQYKIDAGAYVNFTLTGGVSATDEVAAVVFADASASSITIKVADPGNPDGYVEVGAAFVGPLLQPSYNHDRTIPTEEVDPSEVDEANDGTLIINEKSQWRRFQINWAESWLTDADYTAMRAMVRGAGRRTPVVLIADYSNEPTESTAYGYLESWTPHGRLLGKGITRWSLTFREAV